MHEPVDHGAARVSIAVPKPKPKHIRGVTIAFDGRALADHTTFSSLVVKHVPRRAKVRYWSIDVFGNTESVRVIAGPR